MVFRGDDQLFEAGIFQSLDVVVSVKIVFESKDFRRMFASVVFAPFDFVECVGTEVAECSEFVFLVTELVGIRKSGILSRFSSFLVSQSSVINPSGLFCENWSVQRKRTCGSSSGAQEREALFEYVHSFPFSFSDSHTRIIVQQVMHTSR